jgi:hypothetical protein
MGADHDLSATFTAASPPGQHSLTVIKAGTGSGTVTSSPSGIDCGATCSQSFDDGTAVTLTATPDPGSTFTGYTGDCSGSSCSLTMSADHSLAATFTANPPPPSTPNTKIGSAKIDQANNSATFTFTSQGKAKAASGFQCALVKKKHATPKFKGCKSPKTYKHLKPHKYTFEVRAFDSAGKDKTPAKKRFTIKR